MEHDDFVHPAKDVRPDAPARSLPGWVWGAVLVLLVLVVTLGRGTLEEEAFSGGGASPTATIGLEPATPVTGATSGPTAEGDSNYFPISSSLKRGAIAVYLDRQPLSVTDLTPVETPDTAMVLEEEANEEFDGPKYHLYVPAASAPVGGYASRFYYLKVGPNRYLKLELLPKVPPTGQARRSKRADLATRNA